MFDTEAIARRLGATLDAPAGLVPTQGHGHGLAGTTPPASGAEEADVRWRRFARTREPRDREWLILHYAPMAARIATAMGRRMPGNVDDADLVSCAMLGLIDAVERFDPARGSRFEAYAPDRIRGTVADEMRASDWVPRSLRGRARRVEWACAKLESELMRSPSEWEVAEHLGMSRRQVQEARALATRSNPLALDDPFAPDDEASLYDVVDDDAAVDPQACIEEAETVLLLAHAVETLPVRQRLVVVLYHYEGLTLLRIAQMLGVTESRVCQLRRAALERLRGTLRAADAD